MVGGLTEACETRDSRDSRAAAGGAGRPEHPAGDRSATPRAGASHPPVEHSECETGSRGPAVAGDAHRPTREVSSRLIGPCRCEVDAATDPADVTIDVPSLAELLESVSLRENVLCQLNKTGIVVLNLATVDFETDQLALRALFGSVTPHEKADEHGIVRIDIGNPTSVNTAAYAKPHLSHTDEAYCDAPSQILTLMCERAAVDGGESTFVSGQRMLEAVLDAGLPLDPLFEPDCLTVGRMLPGSTELVESTMPVLCRRSEGIANLRFRSLDSYVRGMRADVAKQMQVLHDFTSNPDNQFKVPLRPKQMMILDNTRMVHGRTAFDPSGGRRMNRCNFYNDDGAWASLVSHGLLA